MNETYKCIDARTGVIKPGGVTKPVLILELESDYDQFCATKFFQCDLTPKGNHTAPRNGDFARLYRLTFGIDPGGKLTRADRLLNHYIGKDFYCETTLATDKKTGECYRKVGKISPVKTQKSEDWSQSGKKLKKRKTSSKPLDKNLATTWQDFDNNLTKNYQHFDNDKSLQPAETLGLQTFSIPLNHPQQENYPISTQVKNGEKKSSLLVITDKQKSVTMHQPLPGEKNEDFQDRFLSESIEKMLHGLSAPSADFCKMSLVAYAVAA